MAGWSTSTWNVGSWGTGADNDVIPTGIAAAFGLGTASTDSTVELGWGRDGWNQRSWGAPSQIVTPVTPEDDMTMSLASVSITAEINGGWGAFSWGDNAWGIAANLIASGNAATATLASASVQIDVVPTIGNFNITGTLGSVTTTSIVEVFPTGIAMTSTLANVDAGPDAMATGNAATMALGTIDAFNQTGWGRQGWNVNAWGVEGQFATALVSGNNITATAGTLGMTGDSNLTASTLNVAQITIANVDPAPDTMITGNFMLGALGTLGFQGDVSPSVTGIAMTSALGNETIDLNQEFTVTGIPMNNQLSSAFTAFTDVSVTISGFELTMAQGNGSALIWNEVDTGSAPITPPGWREVAA